MGSNNGTVDALVIGAGASGGAFSWSLANAGFDVMCLEQGDWVDPKAYPSTHQDWETHRLTDFSPDPNLRAQPQDYPVNNDDSPIAPLMYNAVGGSTIHWSGHFPRMHPSDFRVRTLDGVADDWPLSYYDLEPYFDLNDRMIGVAGVTGDPANPPRSPRQTPPVPMGKVGEKVIEGFDNLGWHWWPSDNAVLTAPYDGRAPCNNCGPCDIGCYRRAKASSDVSYWPKAIARGAALKTGARVREITVGADGRASGAVYYDRDGFLHEQKARIVVMACNGVGTPRILLSSQSGRFPNGLANGNGLVGTHLMFHPYAMITGVFDDQLDGHKGPLGCVIMSQEFYESGPEPGLRPRLHPADGPELRPAEHRPRRPRRARRDSMGREPSQHLRRAAWAHSNSLRHWRRPAGGPQPGHAGPRAHGRRRHPRAQDQLHSLGEQPEPAGPRHRPQRRGAGGGGRRAGARQPADAPRRLAPDGHGQDGHGPRRVGRGQRRQEPRGRQPVRDRRQHPHHWRRREPDLNHPGPGAIHSRTDTEDRPRTAGLEVGP